MTKLSDKVRRTIQRVLAKHYDKFQSSHTYAVTFVCIAIIPVSILEIAFSVFAILCENISYMIDTIKNKRGT